VPGGLLDNVQGIGFDEGFYLGQVCRVGIHIGPDKHEHLGYVLAVAGWAIFGRVISVLHLVAELAPKGLIAIVGDFVLDALFFFGFELVFEDDGWFGWEELFEHDCTSFQGVGSSKVAIGAGLPAWRRAFTKISERVSNLVLLTRSDWLFDLRQFVGEGIANTHLS
jgi:hypothetical protein